MRTIFLRPTKWHARSVAPVATRRKVDIGFPTFLSSPGGAVRGPAGAGYGFHRSAFDGSGGLAARPRQMIRPLIGICELVAVQGCDGVVVLPEQTGVRGEGGWVGAGRRVVGQGGRG